MKQFRILDIVFATVLVGLVICVVRDSSERRKVDAAHQDRLDRHFDYIVSHYDTLRYDSQKAWKHIMRLYRGPSTLFREPNKQDWMEAEWDSQTLEDKEFPDE